MTHNTSLRINYFLARSSLLAMVPFSGVLEGGISGRSLILLDLDLGRTPTTLSFWRMQVSRYRLLEEEACIKPHDLPFAGE